MFIFVFITVIAKISMPFKKLNREIQKQLLSKEINAPTPFEAKSIPIIKSGAHVYCVAPEGSGKTTTLILTTLQKLKFRAMGNAPRAIVLVENKDKAFEMSEAFESYTKDTNLRIYVAHAEEHVDLQKSEIAMGIDILISTPEFMRTLFLANGLATSDLQIFSVDDAEFLVDKKAYSAILSITQSIYKCQYVLYCQKLLPMLKRFESHFMEFAKVVKL